MEWMRWLLDNMENELGQDNYLKCIFEGTYRSILKCGNCGMASSIHENFRDLVLPIRSNLMKSFQDFT